MRRNATWFLLLETLPFSVGDKMWMPAINKVECEEDWNREAMGSGERGSG